MLNRDDYLGPRSPNRRTLHLFDVVRPIPFEAIASDQI